VCNCVPSFSGMEGRSLATPLSDRPSLRHDPCKTERPCVRSRAVGFAYSSGLVANPWQPPNAVVIVILGVLNICGGLVLKAAHREPIASREMQGGDAGSPACLTAAQPLCASSS